jgi:hypothetical protein
MSGNMTHAGTHSNNTNGKTAFSVTYELLKNTEHGLNGFLVQDSLTIY